MSASVISVPDMRAKDAKPTDDDRRTADRISRLWDDYKRRNTGPGGKPPTQSVLIEGTGLSQSAISQYLGGRLKFGYGAVLKFAQFFGVPPREIQPNLDALPEQTKREASEWDQVLAYSQAVGLGSGREADEYAEVNKLLFRHSSLSRKHLHASSCRVMFGKGDSMEPTITDGDAILFDASDTTPRNRMVYVLLVDGVAGEEYNVKRCRVSKGEVFFVADNPDGDHDWKEPRPAVGIKVIGRVRWTGGWLK